MQATKGKTKCKHLEECGKIKRWQAQVRPNLPVPTCTRCQVKEALFKESMYLATRIGYSPEVSILNKITYTYDKHAEENRARVKAGYGNEFYDQQDRICDGWEFGTMPPASLRIAHSEITENDTISQTLSWIIRRQRYQTQQEAGIDNVF